MYTAKELECERCLYYGISAGRGVSSKTRLWNQEVYYRLAELDTGFGGQSRERRAGEAGAQPRVHEGGRHARHMADGRKLEGVFCPQ